MEQNLFKEDIDLSEMIRYHSSTYISLTLVSPESFPSESNEPLDIICWFFQFSQDANAHCFNFRMDLMRKFFAIFWRLWKKKMILKILKWFALSSLILQRNQLIINALWELNNSMRSSFIGININSQLSFLCSLTSSKYAIKCVSLTFKCRCSCLTDDHSPTLDAKAEQWNVIWTNNSWKVSSNHPIEPF